jgi:hypothetical protein
LVFLFFFFCVLIHIFDDDVVDGSELIQQCQVENTERDLRYLQVTTDVNCCALCVAIHHGCDAIEYRPAHKLHHDVIGGVADVTLETHVFSKSDEQTTVAEVTVVLTISTLNL